MARLPNFDREEALDRAMGLFWKQGYHATSMKDIEYAMDMRPGSIYATFHSKENLFGEALATYAACVRQNFADALAEGTCHVDGLKHLLVDVALQSQADIPSKSCMMIKTLLELSHTDSDNNKQVCAYLAELETMFKRKFDDASLAGEIAVGANSDELARLYQANVIGISVMAQRQLSAEQVDQLAADMVLRILPQ